jgi:hypothetical protein
MIQLMLAELLDARDQVGRVEVDTVVRHPAWSF